ncbi:MAG: selenium-binding family protein [Planctomycetota bacterium]
MQRREFLRATAATIAGSQINIAKSHGAPPAPPGPGYPSPREAIKAEREKSLHATAIYVGSDENKPDYLATVDVDPESPTYSQVVHRLPMPHVGDELHHFGWNICSSCHGDAGKMRRFLILPGTRSSRIHIVDAINPRAPTMHKIIEGEEVLKKSGLSTPHTVHCLADGHVMLSMLGDREGNGPGGFLLLDPEFNVVGRWERGKEGMKYNYDFWYQPRHNVMVSSEWAAPKTFLKGFDLKDVAAGKYGSQIHFWDWKKREIAQTIDLGEKGKIPLEVRFFHDPQSTHGFVGAALSSVIWHWSKEGSRWDAQPVVEVPPVEIQGWDFPVPSLITDLLVSMDDRFLYFSNWLHGDIRQYDISNPAKPKLTGHVWCGGLLGKGPVIRGRQMPGGPQMLQLSLDGKRLYVTSSLFSSWDNQFYPDIAKSGSFLFQIDCDTNAGGMMLNEDFFVDFGKEPGGPARAHEIRYPGGDCTSDIWT